MTETIQGKVKWFSNQKGFGFITPTSENSPTTEDIFVHQSNIVTEAEYRTLVSGRNLVNRD
jgi:cold shock CspA family protein